MEIFFNWELDESIEQPLHKWVYEDIRNFLRERFKLLEPEIDERKEGEIAFIGVIWSEDGIEIKHFFIHKDLVAKMEEALTQDDLDYIMNHIGQKIDNKTKEN